MATLGHIARGAALVSAALISGAPRAPAGEVPAASGPTRIRARGVEFRRFDPRTGRITMAVSAARASASGESATLDEVKFVRYSPAGATVLEASASGGRILAGGSVAFDGEVVVDWRGAKTVATFRSGAALWDNETGVLSSDGPVSGTLRGARGKQLKGEGAEAFGLDVEGTGLEVRPGDDCGRIQRDVSAVATGVALGAWRVTADGGLGFSGFAGRSPALRFAGPVGIEARGATARADGAEVALHEGKGKQGLAVSRAWLVGTVHARIDGARTNGARTNSARTDSAGAPPWGEGSVEIRAEAAEIAFDAPGDPSGPGARAILLGTESDPARVSLPRGVLRGTRVEITRGSVRTDGGARSEFEWGGKR